MAVKSGRAVALPLKKEQAAHAAGTKEVESMKNWLRCSAAVLVAACGFIWLTNGLTAQAPASAPKELMFTLVKIDGPAHNPPMHTYWFGPFAECSSVLDINGDGKLDIAAGRNYYLAPDWRKVSGYRDGAATNGPDVDDNYEGTMDVNNDGRPDVLSSGWMLKQGVFWYENPGKEGVQWKSHTLHLAEGLEGMVIGNLAGRGGKDVLINYFARRPGRGLIWFEHIGQPPWFKEHKLGPENVGVSHGSGIGDINMDGRHDVVTTSGWFESPPNPTGQQWIWHPDYQFSPFGGQGRPGGAGLPMLVYDVNEDGLNDILIGSDHGYGLGWFEQKLTGGKRAFELHWIETDYPTFHTMALADLDGDGRGELITGKQLLAHNGGDVGALEPTFVFYYTIDKGRFQRHILSYSHLEPYFDPAYKGPPPDFVIGVGMRLSTGDLDGNGMNDIVVACRSGLYVFFNKGYSPRTRGRNPLPPRESYPGNVMWEKPRAAIQPPGGQQGESPNKFTGVFKDLARTGSVGPQDHGTPVWRRNPQMRPLREAAK
jgi:hypothetical protein